MRLGTKGWAALAIVGAVAFVAWVLFGPLLDDTSTPHEVFGRLPSEWRSLWHGFASMAFMLGLAASWVVALMLLQRATKYTRNDPSCAKCGYTLTGLSTESVCPECGTMERASALPPLEGARLAAPLVAYGVIVAASMLVLAIIATDHLGFALLHLAASVPLLMIPADRRLSTREATFVTVAIALTYGLGLIHAFWEFKHSRDGLAFVGILGAGCLGWMMVGPAYLIAAAGVYLRRRRAGKAATASKSSESSSRSRGSDSPSEAP
jgi:hypothetical protein